MARQQPLQHRSQDETARSPERGLVQREVDFHAAPEGDRSGDRHAPNDRTGSHFRHAVGLAARRRIGQVGIEQQQLAQ